MLQMVSNCIYISYCKNYKKEYNSENMFVAYLENTCITSEILEEAFSILCAVLYVLYVIDCKMAVACDILML